MKVNAADTVCLIIISISIKIVHKVHR